MCFDIFGDSFEIFAINELLTLDIGLVVKYSGRTNSLYCLE